MRVELLEAALGIAKKLSRFSDEDQRIVVLLLSEMAREEAPPPARRAPRGSVSARTAVRRGRGETAKTIVAMLKKRGPMTAPQIADALGTRPPNIKRALLQSGAKQVSGSGTKWDPYSWGFL